MNLSKLFEMQRKLDEHIIEKKCLQGQDLLPNTILALYAELGELLNECRFFKQWSDDKEMRRDKALVEYIDCLHLILSIGNQLNINTEQEFMLPGESDLSQCFALVYRYISILWSRYRDDDVHTPVAWLFAFQQILCLGELLGFTWSEIEQAYMNKNKINHERQDNGY